MTEFNIPQGVDLNFPTVAAPLKDMSQKKPIEIDLDKKKVTARIEVRKKSARRDGTTKGWHDLGNGYECYIDPLLKSTLDTLVWNCNKDWDFVIIITGDGMVRTGKSVLGMNVATYLAKELGTPFSLKGNVFFDSKTMIEKAQEAPKNSVLLYDEAREGLATSKRFSKMQQDLIDFFNECGQLNHIFILVLPDFFSLNWELATNRSELLLNVYRREDEAIRTFKNKEKRPTLVFQRGYWELYNRPRKAELYHKGKRTGMRNYGLGRRNCYGLFRNHYPLDEVEYRSMKKESLKRFSERHKAEEKRPRLSNMQRASVHLIETIQKSHKNIKLPEIAEKGEFDRKIYTIMKYEWSIGGRKQTGD